MKGGVGTVRGRALGAVDKMPEHELRRLLERMAVTDPIVVWNAIERMDTFDAWKRDRP